MAQNKEFVVSAIAGFYGVHIEGDINQMYSDNFGSVSGKGGLSFGLNIKHGFSRKLYGAFDIRYSQKGSVYSFTTNYGTRAFESIMLNYIEIPLLLGIDFKVKKKHLFVETGLGYGRLLSAKMDVSDLYDWDTTEKTDGFKNEEITWVANVKYPIVQSGKLLTGIRFSYSLNSIHKDYNLHNLVYGIEVYYLF